MSEENVEVVRVTGGVEMEELIDGTRDRVLAVARVVARGKGSGAPVLQPVFSAFTVRNGKVARIEDHTERAKALEAVGLRERVPAE